jgi:prepilin-type processing-associated H-X9-DG protein
MLAKEPKAASSASFRGKRMELRGQIAHFARVHIDRAAVLASLEEGDGHAGLTFLFDVALPAGDRVSYVLKLAPKGVRRAGNTDVYRQAPLLRALHGQGLPVPSVPWAGEDEGWFGVPYIVMERLPGRTFQHFDTHPSFPRTAAFAISTWRQAAEALPQFHKFDWRKHLANWQCPEDLREQVERWRAIYVKSPVEEWLRAAEKVEALLLEHLPNINDNPIGLIHGDYQPGNVLYVDGQATGVIDWELSGIGGQLLDIGWLMMMSDRTFQDQRPESLPALDPAEMREIYEAGMGRTFKAIPWFRAYAGFRMGSIACLNVRLHRNGRRHDPTWEQVALGVPDLFGNARAILENQQ